MSEAFSLGDVAEPTAADMAAIEEEAFFDRQAEIDSILADTADKGWTGVELGYDASVEPTEVDDYSGVKRDY